MGSMPEYDIDALEENAERIDGRVLEIRAAIEEEQEAKLAHDKTIMALDAGVGKLEEEAKGLRAMAEQIRTAEVQRVGRGDTDDRPGRDADDARHGGAA